jgi:hypothetical protein
MGKILAGASTLALLLSGAAQAQEYYGPPPAPPYSAGGGYAAAGDCRFTLAGVHAGVTLLGVEVGGGVRASLPADCPQEASYGGEPVGAVQPYGVQPSAYGYQGGYPPPQGYYPQPAAYPQPVAYPAPYASPSYAPAPYGYAPPPCGCQASVVYQPY